MSAADLALDRVSLAAAELRHFLRLSLDINEQGALRTAVRKRVTEVTGHMPPDDQVWFVALLHEMASVLRGARAAGNAMQAVLARIGGAETEAGATLAAPPRPYKLTSHGGVTIDFAPKMMTAFVVGDVASSWKPPAASGAQAAQLTKIASHGLMREQAPGLLDAAQAAWRDGSYDRAWDDAVRKLHARSNQPFIPWGLNHLALMAALLAPDRIEGSPWLGPLKAQMTAALHEGGAWEIVLRHVLAGDGGSKPSKSIAKTSSNLIAAIGGTAFRGRVMGWLEEHPLDPQLPDPDQDAFKQLIWMVGTTGESSAVPLGQLAQRCFVKVPNLGARSVKLGNAALAALGMVEPPAAGAAELDRLRQRVKYPSAQKQIETALQAAAKRAGLTTEDLAELAVPDFDLSADGTARVATAEGAALLRLTAGRTVSLDWQDAAGRTVAAAPAALKKAHGALVKEWTERKRALEATISGQLSRIEGLFESKRDWEGAAWVQRYARHALLGPLARRLIWRVTRADGSSTAMLPNETALFDAAGCEIALGNGDRVRLWHPIDASVDEVLAWRARIVSCGIVQPFKQAHREIYRLTDAERETATYSNRFAGHFLRQHQMLALAKARGWTGTLQGSFDGANDPTKTYSEYGLRVAFGAEGVEGHEGDLSPHGICLRVAADRVRFFKAQPAESRKARMGSAIERMRAIRAGERVTPRLPAGPVPLVDIPARLFSEAMRDVDLFVGVASLGADPAWEDGGPDGRFGEYWRGYANAELMESGKARHAALAALLTRLNIASDCTLEARHLVVRGRLKTYRIHIGSGSIFFQPEGQYLCIVPARGTAQEEVALPFEGDGMLSTILSKAMLLARDDLIKDPSILTQLGRLPGTT